MRTLTGVIDGLNTEVDIAIYALSLADAPAFVVILPRFECVITLSWSIPIVIVKVSSITSGSSLSSDIYSEDTVTLN